MPPARGPRAVVNSDEDSRLLMGVDAHTGRWETIPVTIDSGVVDTVGPKIAGRAFPIVPTRESRIGLGYRAANGSPIKNYGERTIEGITDNGKGLRMKVTVADVNKVLASVSKMCECGNRVVFDEDGSYVENKKTGERMVIEEDDGDYVLDVWVKLGQEHEAPFGGQVQRP